MVGYSKYSLHFEPVGCRNCSRHSKTHSSRIHMEKKKQIFILNLAIQLKWDFLLLISETNIPVRKIGSIFGINIINDFSFGFSFSAVFFRLGAVTSWNYNNSMPSDQLEGVLTFSSDQLNWTSPLNSSPFRIFLFTFCVEVWNECTWMGHEI